MRFLEVVLDTLIPLRARAARTRDRTIGDIALCPASHDLLRKKIVTLMDYQDPAVRDLVQSLKYDNSSYAAHLAAEILSDYLQEEMSQQKTFSPRSILVVPVPLGSGRYQERGFNQIARVADYLPRHFHDGTLSRVAKDALRRDRETKPQTRLSRSERLSNVAGAFSVSDAKQIQDTHVFLIDDVTTTGATLVNAAHPLRRSGATVTLIALARA